MNENVDVNVELDLSLSLDLDDTRLAFVAEGKRSRTRCVVQ
jgi:hypothetical protein